MSYWYFGENPKQTAVVTTWIASGPGPVTFPDSNSFIMTGNGLAFTYVYKSFPTVPGTDYTITYLSNSTVGSMAIGNTSLGVDIRSFTDHVVGYNIVTFRATTTTTWVTFRRQSAGSVTINTVDFNVSIVASSGYTLPPSYGFSTQLDDPYGAPLYVVSKLTDDGTQGTLRDAVSTGARCIAFTVGGVINLGSDLNLNDDNIVLLGNTAPSPGITIQGKKITSRGGIKIFKHISFVRRYDPSDLTNASAFICAFDNAISVTQLYFDHCLFAWGLEDLFHVVPSLTPPVVPDDPVTVAGSISCTWCIFTEPLWNPHTYNAALAGHSSGDIHAHGAVIGERSYGIDFQNCLFANCYGRSLKIGADTRTFIANNVFLNYGLNALVFQSIYTGIVQSTVMGNVAISGPNTVGNKPFVVWNAPALTDSSIYFANNSVIQGAGAAISLDPNLFYNSAMPVGWTLATDPPIIMPNVDAKTQSQLISDIQINCGPHPRQRANPIASRAISQMVSRTGLAVNHENEVGGPVVLTGTTRTLESVIGLPVFGNVAAVLEWSDKFNLMVQFDGTSQLTNPVAVYTLPTYNFGISAVPDSQEISAGVPFALGEVPNSNGATAADQFIITGTVDNVSVPCQLSKRVYWNDGSLKFAQAKFKLPEIPVSSNRNIVFSKVKGTWAANDVGIHTSTTAVTDNSDFKVTLTNLTLKKSSDPTVTFSSDLYFSVNQAFATGKVEKLYEGPVCTEWRVKDLFRKVSDDTVYDAYHAEAYIRAWGGTVNVPDKFQVYIKCVFAGLYPYSAVTGAVTTQASMITHDINYYSGDTVVRGSLVGTTGWTQVRNSRGAAFATVSTDGLMDWFESVTKNILNKPTVYSRHSPQYLVSTKLAIPIDLNQTVFDSAFSSTASVYRPMGSANITKDMGDVGDRDDISMPWSGWSARAILAQNSTFSLTEAMNRQLVARANAVASMSLFCNNSDRARYLPLYFLHTTPPTDLSPTRFGIQYNPAIGWTDPAANNNWSTAVSHYPDYNYYIYLTEGDQHHWDQMATHACHHVHYVLPAEGFNLIYFGGQTSCTAWNSQPRSGAWLIRNICNSVALGETSEPHYKYLRLVLDENIRVFDIIKSTETTRSAGFSRMGHWLSPGAPQVLNYMFFYRGTAHSWGYGITQDIGVKRMADHSITWAAGIFGGYNSDNTQPEMHYCPAAASTYAITSRQRDNGPFIANWQGMGIGGPTIIYRANSIFEAGSDSNSTPSLYNIKNGDRLAIFSVNIFNGIATVGTGIVEGQMYYVVGLIGTGGPTSKFQISLTSGGTPVTVSGVADGTVTYAYWIHTLCPTTGGLSVDTSTSYNNDAMVALKLYKYYVGGTAVTDAALVNNTNCKLTSSGPNNFVNKVKMLIGSVESVSDNAVIIGNSATSSMGNENISIVVSPINNVNLLDFGGNGNGSFDNTTAIKNALAAANSANKAVFIPAGKFNHSARITLNSAQMLGNGASTILYATNPGDGTGSIVIYGVGSELKKMTVTALFAPRGGDASVLVTVNSGVQPTGWLIEDVTMAGNISSLAQTAPSLGGFFIYGGGQGIVRYCTLKGSVADTIHMTNASQNILVERNIILNSRDDGIACVTYNGGTGSSLVRNIEARFNTVLDNIAGRGITVVGSHNAYYHDNHVRVSETYNTAGIYIASEGSYNSGGNDNFRCIHNTVKRGGGVGKGHSAILLYNSQKAAGYYNDTITVTGNSIWRPKIDAIRINGDTGGLRNSVISGNLTYGDPRANPTIDPWGATNTTITNNQYFTTAQYPGDMIPESIGTGAR
jgi:hypothetical protein